MKSTLKNIWQMPGSVIYTWDRMTVESKVQMIQYDESGVEETHVSDFLQCKETTHFWVTWIDFIGLDQTNDLEEIGQLFSLHPLILEDIANIQQRPKIEDLEQYVFVSLKMFEYHRHTQTLEEEQISLVLWSWYLISFQEREKDDDFTTVKDRIKKWKWRIRKMWADYLMYSLIDAIVDNYFVVLESIEDDIELLQDELVKNPTKHTLPKIQKLKQNLIKLRKSIWPVREMISSLQRIDASFIHPELPPYLRDLYDHTVQIVDSIETFRDIISWSLDIYLSSISNKMNAVMKVLTVISTIFVPLTFLVGVYGMNFTYMPELSMKWTYPVLWIIMISVAAGMLYFFRKKHRF